MSDTGKDANPLAQASEKVENVASDAAQAAKEKAAQMQPGGSQVGDVVQEKSDGSEKKAEKP